MMQIGSIAVIFALALWLGCEGVIGLKKGVVRGKNNVPVSKIEAPATFWILVVFDLVFALSGCVFLVVAVLEFFGVAI